MEQLLPVGGHTASRARDGLVDGMVPRRCQCGALVGLLIVEVVVPVLARLVGLDPRVMLLAGMASRVLLRRGVAAANAATLSATPQMEPPSAEGLAVRAARPARRHHWVDPVDRHELMVGQFVSAASRHPDRSSAVIVQWSQALPGAAQRAPPGCTSLSERVGESGWWTTGTFPSRTVSGSRSACSQRGGSGAIG